MCCNYGLCDILYRFALNALGHLLRHLARTRLAEAGVGLGREPRHCPHLLSHLGMDSSHGGWSRARSRAEASSSFIKPSGHGLVSRRLESGSVESRGIVLIY